MNKVIAVISSIKRGSEIKMVNLVVAVVFRRAFFLLALIRFSYQWSYADCYIQGSVRQLTSFRCYEVNLKVLLN